MPSSRRAVRATDTYRRQAQALRARAEHLTKANWALVRGANLDTSHAAYVAVTAPALTTLQRAGARLASGYLAAYVAVELGTHPQPRGHSARASSVGQSRAGKPLADALGSSLFIVKKQIKDGQDIDVALDTGLARAVMNAGEDAIFAARDTLSEGIRQDDRVIGWRRVSSGGCGACDAAATGAIQEDDQVLEVHPACACDKEPVVAGAPDTVQRPTGEEMFHAMSTTAQDAMLGVEKAQLVRGGDVPFHALLDRSPMTAMPDMLTEAPLAALLH